MGKINITKHALMRYASRVYKYQIINDRTFDIWKKQNEDKIEGLETDLKVEFQGSEYICTAAYDSHKKAEFYINKDKMMTYVIVGNNMVTCYPIDYELDTEGNRAILDVLLNNLKRARIDEDNFEDKYFKERDDLKQERELVQAEIELLNSKIKKLQEKKAGIENRQLEIIGEQQELRNIIKVAEEKIVRSKLAL
ncbi:hypothetical protein KST09_11720 [Fusobacterium animalis]|jgi:hypothetical protein|uniref:hypothetical protein n=1 Tax=Fusobacterium animalis TaxID=76859 RepID=UPI0030CE9C46